MRELAYRCQWQKFQPFNYAKIFSLHTQRQCLCHWTPFNKTKVHLSLVSVSACKNVNFSYTKKFSTTHQKKKKKRERENWVNICLLQTLTPCIYFQLFCIMVYNASKSKEQANTDIFNYERSIRISKSALCRLMILLRMTRVTFLWKIEDPKKYNFHVVIFKVENHNSL